MCMIAVWFDLYICCICEPFCFKLFVATGFVSISIAWQCCNGMRHQRCVHEAVGLVRKHFSVSFQRYNLD